CARGGGFTTVVGDAMDYW
nr:immunoglobulin heavy chain junction region [Mus musculus]